MAEKIVHMHGYKQVITVTDCFSKCVEAVAVKEKTADTIAEFLAKWCPTCAEVRQWPYIQKPNNSKAYFYLWN